MSCERQTEVYQPVALTPLEVKVPVYVDLPADLLTPCQRPLFDEIEDTDVFAVLVAARWRVTAECNENKLRRIEQEQGQKVDNPPAP